MYNSGLQHKRMDFSKRIACVFCAFLLFISSFPYHVVAETAEQRYERLQGELAVISEQIADTTENLENAETERNILLDEQAILNEMIDLNQQDIETTRQRLADKEEEMALKREELNTTRELLGRRLVAMYTENNVSTLSSLLSVDNFSEFLQIVDAMRRISHEDQELIENMQQQQADLELEQENIQLLLADLESSYDSLDDNASALATNLQTQNSEISEQDALLRANEEAYGATAAEAEIAYQEMLAASNSVSGLGSSPGEGIPGTEPTPAPSPAPEPTPEPAPESTPTSNTTEPAPNSETTSEIPPTSVEPAPPVETPAPEPVLGAITTWPVPSSRRITCYYGEPDPAGRAHLGLDVAAPLNTPIVAVGNGTVVLASSHSSYGNYLIIDHGNGLKSLYAHCNSLLVGVGTYVTAGSTVALMGSTGFSTGSHLHLEIHNPGRQDPLPYLP